MSKGAKGGTFRLLVAIAGMFLPWRIKKWVFKSLLGYRLDPNSYIGFSLVSVSSLEMGTQARIGHLTICRGLQRILLEDYASIGNLNWITGGTSRPLWRTEGASPAVPALHLATHSAITNRHYVDCSDTIAVGAYTTIAGVRSQLFTHSIDLEICGQRTSPIAIGRYCLIGTGTIVLPGAKLPDFSILGAGSVLVDAKDEPWTLYSGVPARATKSISREDRYFSRQTGYVE